MKKEKSPSIEDIRHSLAHLLAAAVKEYRSGVKFGLGPTIENGFYYDFDFLSAEARSDESAQSPPESTIPPASGSSRSLSEADLPKLEARIKELIKKDLPIERKLWPTDDLRRELLRDRQDYKLELLAEIESGQRGAVSGEEASMIQIYQVGDFRDICKGGHVARTGEIPADSFKLTRLAGAYWRGNELRPQMTRVYGLAFRTKKELQAYLENQEKAVERDHRKIGKEQDLFSISPLVGPGLPLWHSKGEAIRHVLIEELLRPRLLRLNYQIISTPHIGTLELYKTSGHYQKYKDDMFPTIKLEGNQYVLRPMNCPHAIQVYAERPRSYRELPIKLAEFGATFRYERSGELLGLTRVRAFTVDDGHIFAREDQIKAVFLEVIGLIEELIQVFDFENYRFRFGVRGKGKANYIGSDSVWQSAEKAIEEAIGERGLDCERAEGEAAFYGPKLDLLVQDSLGREWQLGTSQVDYNLPERFALSYVGEDGGEHRPVIIHRAILGSLERFIGILLEHFNGGLPFWLAPIQVVVLDVSDRVRDYSHKVADKLKEVGFRVEADFSNNTIGWKIRHWELQKVPYILVIGEKEEEAKTVSLRERGAGNRGEVKIAALVKEVSKHRLST